jgi:hypothetical protein
VGHQWLHPSLHKTEGHVLASMSTLMRANSSGSWIPSCIVGSVFH